MKFEGNPNPPETLEALRAKVQEQAETIAALERRLEAEEEKSKTDFLTGLKNRRGLEEAATYILPEATIEGQPEQRKIEKEPIGAVLYLDIDDFKEINDQYGHAEGDRIIKEAADILTHFIRPNDVVARMGGDEFVILLNGASEDVVHKFLDPNTDPPRARFGFTALVGGKEQRISFSGGIALIQHGETIADLNHMIDRADQALYKSKTDGRDRLTLFKPAASNTSADLPANET
jgi:diguanylate cyclase (GGDEF)-like protein